MLRYFGAARIRAIAAHRGRNVSGVGHVVVPHAEAPADSWADASAAQLSAPAPPPLPVARDTGRKRRGRPPKSKG
jgi:hypothetical protein